MRFRAEVRLGGKTATAIEVPDEVVASEGNRPKVRVTIGGHTCRTTGAGRARSALNGTSLSSV